MKNLITMKVINYKENRAMLMDTPHKRVDDLAVIYQIDLPVDKESTGTIRITDAEKERFGVSTEQLHELAMTNTRRLYPPVLSTMEAVMFKNAENLLENPMEAKSDMLYILTNTRGAQGATSILYPDVLEQAKQIIGSDFYVLPSSIHEMILVSKEHGMPPKELGEMVREVNANQVRRDEKLSDHVYEIDFSEKQLKTVKESLPREKSYER